MMSKRVSHVRPSFLTCARDGYYFCRDCRQVVALTDHFCLAGKCAECGSVRVHWQPPVFGRESAADFLLARASRQDAD